MDDKNKENISEMIEFSYSCILKFRKVKNRNICGINYQKYYKLTNLYCDNSNILK